MGGDHDSGASILVLFLSPYNYYHDSNVLLYCFIFGIRKKKIVIVVVIKRWIFVLVYFVVGNGSSAVCVLVNACIDCYFISTNFGQMNKKKKSVKHFIPLYFFYCGATINTKQQ